jgi:serine/threonine-protein kinase
LELDEELPEAHNWLGMYYMWYEFDWSRAEKEFLRSIQLNANAVQSHEFYSWLLIARQRTDEALREARTAADLEPLSPEPQALGALVFFFARRYDESVARLQKIAELDPNYPFFSLFTAFNYIQLGKYAEAVTLMQKSHTLFDAPWSHARVAYAYAMSGMKREALGILDSLRNEQSKAYVASDIVASVYVAFGDNDKAIEYLRKGYQERAGWMIWLKVDPIWDPIRQDPRFDEVLTHMKLK